jgi:YVTN family beta-propeller protein
MYSFSIPVATDIDATHGNSPIASCGLMGLPTGLSAVGMPAGATCTIDISGTVDPSVTPGSFALTLFVTDTDIMQDAVTVVSGATMTQMGFDLMVVADMSVTLVVDPAATFDDSTAPAGIGVVPDAVTGRPYGDDGTGTTGRSDLLFTVTGGLSPYMWSTMNVPAGIVCTQQGGNNQMLRCNSAGANVTGVTSDLTFTVTDGSNLAVASGMTSTDTNGHTAHTLAVQAALAIDNNSLPNGLVDFPYSVQFTVTGGLPAPMSPWVAPGSMSGGCSGGSAPTGTLPPGTALSASTGMLTAASLTMASTTITEFTFQVCYTDNGNDTTPAGAGFPPVDQNTSVAGNDYVVNVLTRHAYVATDGLDPDIVEVVDTAGDTRVTSIDPTGANLNPEFVAVTPDGRFAYVGLNNETVDAIDTITKTVLRNVNISSACSGSINGMAAADIPTVGTRVYAVRNAANNGIRPNVVVINPNNYAFLAIPVSDNGDDLRGVAFSPDGTRAYVTNNQNEVVVVDTAVGAEITASRFPIGGTAGPRGIAIVPNNAGASPRLLAYIAKQTDPGAVAVVDVTTDTLALVIERAAPTADTEPYQVAARAVPSGQAPEHVFVSQFQSNTQYLFMDNTVAMPTIAPVMLTDVTANGNRRQSGVTAPPVPSGTPKVYFAINSNNDNNGNSVYSVMDLATPDGGARIDLTNGSTPEGIAHTPQPSGLVLDGSNVDRTQSPWRLPNAPTANMPYPSTSVAVQGAVGQISFAGTTFPSASCGTLTINSVSGLISGSVGGSGTCTVNLNVTDSGRPGGVLITTISIVVP